jgi:putative endopeptidase
MTKLLLVVVATVWAACLGAQGAPPAGTGTFLAADRDTTCAACTDFYTFVNGGWLARTPIPAAYSSWGSFAVLDEQNQGVLQEMMERLAANPSAVTDPTQQKIGTFFAACMDSAGRESAGMEPIEPLLRRVDAVSTVAEFRALLGTLRHDGFPLVFRFDAEPDAKNSEEIIAGIGQGGLGLPERDYYFRTDAKSVALRKTYHDHVAATLHLTGALTARADADQIMKLETALARASQNAVESRDPQKTYHRMTTVQLRALAPSFDWPAYFQAVGLSGLASVDVQHPPFVRAVDSLMQAVPLATWKAYARYHLVSELSNTLGSPFVDEAFRYQQALTGAKEQLPLVKRCVRFTGWMLNDPVGHAFVENRFPPAAKARALEMLANIKAVLHDHIEHATWMGDSTKVAATRKLAAIVDKIGYPDKWRDYSGLTLTPGRPLFGDVVSVRRFNTAYELGKIGKPHDRTDWTMSVYVVNANYEPSNNDVTFPAGILQPPFFDPNADDAVNYGAFGVAIGHEVTHGFDDQGAQYDEKGNLRDWWTASDKRQFKARGKGIIDQFSAYTILDSLHVRGDLTEGENIADLGGLTMAYEALERSMAGKPRPPLIDGFTPEQRFFMAWAKVWRVNERAEMQRQLVLTNEHSPNKWRVNGPMSNMPEFAKAWGCKSGDAMVRPPSERVAIW